MSTLSLKNNLIESNWEMTAQNINPYFMDLCIGFTSDSSPVVFSDLYFKFELKKGNEIVNYGEYPVAGARYIQTDEEFLVVQRISLVPESNYSIYVWSINQRVVSESTFDFSTNRPPQPFSSWIWDSENKVWEAPVPYPDDGNNYRWDEDTQSWVEITEDY